MEGKNVAPEALTEEEIWQKIGEFRQAARNVVDAGGDGVEIHGAHGDSINNRTDKWGGSVENRARFLLEVIKATVEEIGAERTALRLSPFATYQAAYTSNTWDQFGYIFNELKKAGYKLAYVSLVEPRGNPATILATPKDLASDKVSPFGDRKQSLEYFLEIYKKWDVVVAFGRWFISNPDLVYRLKYGVPLTPYQRDTFYAPKTDKGYNDYTFSPGYLEATKA
ncbi:hypothetical protein Lal_00009245 [Lupinus albus]|nr:hypothetical protein Lal_00009245 [Lupinus albus]